MLPRPVCKGYTIHTYIHIPTNESHLTQDQLLLPTPVDMIRIKRHRTGHDSKNCKV